jgi:vacuolar fusion protein MON1
MLVARGRVVTLVRPRKHSIHPAGELVVSGTHRVLPFATDIHILLNTIQASSILNSLSSASWIPVCLPKFNPAGYVNTYISFLEKGESEEKHNQDTKNAVEPAGHTVTPNPSRGQADMGVALVCITGGGEIESIRGWCDSIAQVWSHSDTLLVRIDKLWHSGWRATVSWTPS